MRRDVFWGTRDISLSGVFFAGLPDALTRPQQQSDDLGDPWRSCETRDANVIKLPKTFPASRGRQTGCAVKGN